MVSKAGDRSQTPGMILTQHVALASVSHPMPSLNLFCLGAGFESFLQFPISVELSHLAMCCFGSQELSCSLGSLLDTCSQAPFLAESRTGNRPRLQLSKTTASDFHWVASHYLSAPQPLKIVPNVGDCVSKIRVNKTP